uniref:Mce/MlaD domain-containing protein n=1 Tax=Callithamnion tetricum TaxID=193179 RepID=A0A4D6WM76_9FLOR|nr:hypothetical protein [Callithamnion tetricum]
MRGVTIGYIQSLQVNTNYVIVLAYIKSKYILIPKSSIVETNQTGLFNDTTIDIIPLKKLSVVDFNKINVFSKSCLYSSVLCNYHYIRGERGLNYDDLIRATTRISQRFDDPRFFNLFYLFLQNCIDISDEIVLITTDISQILSLFNFWIENILGLK